MFISSDQACNFRPNSRYWTTPGQIARCNAAETAMSNAIVNANTGWVGLIQRNWRSFADQGPEVAFQLRNDGPNQVDGGGVAFGVPSPSTSVPDSDSGPGVDLIAQGNPVGSNPAAGGDAGSPGRWGRAWAARNPGGSSGRWGRGRTTGSLSPYKNSFQTPNNGGTDPSGGRDPGGGGPVRRNGKPQPRSDASDIVNYFGYQPDYKTYTGPLPVQGTVKSLAIGGSNRPSPVGPGAPSKRGLNPIVGYPAGSMNSAACNPAGVAMLPWGEPDYGSLVAGSDTGGAAGLDPWAILAGVAVLFGAAYLLGDQDRRRA